jgi:undecaprenyl-diphosphatase
MHRFDDSGMETLQAWIATAARHDARLYDRVVARRSPRWNAPMIALTRSGDARAYLVLAALGFVLGGAAQEFGLRAGLAAATASALGYVVKRALRRPRPTTRREAREALLAHPDAWSFPSSHTAAAFAAAMVAAAPLGPLALGLLLAWAAAVGVSRVYVGAHYPLDVLLGAVLGAAVGAGLA